MEYRPKPIDTERVKLSEDMIELTEYLAENTHEIWSQQRMSEGWIFGEERDDKKKHHPCLVPYEDLPEVEKDYDRNTALGAIKLILSLGYNIELPVHKISHREKKMHKNLLSFLKSGEADLEQLLHVWHQHEPESWRHNEELYITLAERILKFAEPLQAFDIIQEGTEAFPGNVRLRELKGLTLARLGSYEKANNVLYELYQSAGKDRIETLGMLGRTHKDLWLSSTNEKDKKYHISKSREYYLEAYKLEPSVWTGINVAATYAFEGNLTEAQKKAAEIKNLCEIDLSDGSQNYWLLATMGEANLILGEYSDAVDYYKQAVAIGKKNIGDINSTRRNARLLFDGLTVPEDVVKQVEHALCIPKIVVFTGHMIDSAKRKKPRFPRSAEKQVYDEIYKWLETQGPCVGFCSAAKGADILFIEAMEALGNKVSIIMPFCKEQFFEESVKDEDDKSWEERFWKIVNGKHEIIELNRQGTTYSDYYFQYANNIMYGLSRIRAQQLDTTLIPLAVWHKEDIGKTGGSSSFIKKWLELGNEVNIIDLKAIIDKEKGDDPFDIVKKEAVQELDYYDDYKIKGILFADTVNYSQLQDHEFLKFENIVFGIVKEMIDSGKYDVATKNTWGDAIYMVFDKIKDAGNFALELNEKMNEIDWYEAGFSMKMKVRTAVHAGPVHCSFNPVTGQMHFNGANVCRAARIEPLTPPGQVYTSIEYAALAASEHIKEFQCVYVGQMSMPKKYGVFPTFHLRRTE
ncbi:MAG: DUF4071 domain-containing protein [Deltaproteobacteria bacterium]|nr:MAG: DUF4071 domain-containing protein [Deltaproteobacteria bacterium]